MGMTKVTLRIKKNREAECFKEMDFLVDSGAAYTVVPAAILKELGIKAFGEKSFFLANGEKITRKTGEAYFELRDNGGTSKVIFGQKGDTNLLGVLTLEALEVVLDPMTRELKPLPMFLM